MVWGGNWVCGGETGFYRSGRKMIKEYQSRTHPKAIFTVTYYESSTVTYFERFHGGEAYKKSRVWEMD
jgi:hypothetical protein